MNTHKRKSKCTMGVNDLLACIVWMSALYSLLALFLLSVGGGRLLYEQFYAEQGCEMTWMYQWPKYLKVPMSNTIQSSFPQYGLYLYTEGDKKEEESVILSSKLSGVPVLFIPGNAGSHRQARSSASIALRMHIAEFPHLRHFDFFTVKFNEELSGLFGGVLRRQAEYVSLCISHILNMYTHLPTRPVSVVIIAHSMGGVVAHSLFSLDGFNTSAVHTIVAMASPLLRPVISMDSLLYGFYKQEGGASASHVTVVSIAGGKRDVMVPTLLTTLPGAINLASPAIPRNWASADHRAIVWCRRVQLALTRALFLLQDPVSGGLIRDKSQRDATFTHLLLRGREIPQETTPTHKIIKKSSVTMLNGSAEGGRLSYRLEGRVGQGEYMGVKLTGHAPIHVTSNTDKSLWVFVCDQTLNCTSLSSRASLLPPKVGVVKSVFVSPNDFEGDSLLVIAQPTKHHPTSKGLTTINQCDASRNLNLSIWGATLSLPHTHCSFMNVSLLNLKEIWHTYKAVITSSCGEVRAQLSTPWYPHLPPTHSPPSHPHNITLSLSLQVPTPSNQTPQLLIWSPPDCPLTLQISPDPLELLDKLLMLYSPFLLPWVTALCIAGQQLGLGAELLVIVTLYGLTSAGWIPYTDWQELSDVHLWGGFSPLAIHLVARGLVAMLGGMMRLTVALIQKICGCGSCLRWMPIVIGVISVAGVMVCSGVGAISLLVTWLFIAASSNHHIHLLPVLVCMNIVTLPTVVSWIKGLSFHPLLSPDPHFVGVLATVCITMVTIWQSCESMGSQKRYWAPLLATLLFCYATVCVHRLLWFSLLYIIGSLLEQLTSLHLKKHL